MKVTLIKDFKSRYECRIHLNRDPSGLLFYIYSLGYEENGPKYYLDRANMPYYMMTLITNGTGYFTYQGHKYNLKPNSLILINGIDRHILEAGENGMTIYFMHIHMTSLINFNEFVQKENGPIIDLGNDNRVYHIIKSICENANENTLDDLETSKQIYEAMLIIRSIVFKDTESLTLMPDPVRNVAKYIAGNYNNDITLEQIARDNGISKYYLEKIFRKYLKTTVYQYLLDTRVERAKYLLLMTDMTISEIAENTGLNDSQTFIRVFKDHMGETPHQFRKARIK